MEEADYVIVGGGVAGLRAAQELSKKGYSVLVLEARGLVGGRVGQSHAFLPGETIELGAEFCHAPTNSRLGDIIRENGWAAKEVFTWAHGDGGPSEEDVDGMCGYYWVEKDRRLLRYDDTDSQLQQLHSSIDNLATLEVPNGDPRTLKQYLSETVQTEKIWLDEDHGDSRLEDGFGQLIKYLSPLENARYRVVVNTPVKMIAYACECSSCSDCVVCGGGAIVVAANGTRYAARRGVAVAVPHAILQDGDIEFSPPLRKDVKEAIDTIGISREGMKIFVKLRGRPVWPDDYAGGTCCGAEVSEVWWQHVKNEPNTFMFTGFITGERVTTMKGRCGAKNYTLMASLFVQQLDRMFEGASGPHAVSDMYTGEHFVSDWGSDPFIRCSYSYPSVGSHLARMVLCEATLNGRVVFCGEAISDIGGLTIQAALLSAENAAQRLLIKKSKL